MSVKLPYKKYPDGKGGFNLFAVVEVNIARPVKNAPRSKRFEALIDSGAHRCTFLAPIGRAIGIDIEQGEVEESYGISGEPTKTFVHKIHLYTPGGVIPISAAFSDSLPVAAILGMNGFFDHFRVTFDPTAQRVELERLFRA